MSSQNGESARAEESGHPPAVEQPAADQAISTDALPAVPETEAEAERGASSEVIGVRRGMFGVSDDGDTSGYNRLVRPVRMPGATPRPYGPNAPDQPPTYGEFDEVADELAAVLRDNGLPVERVIQKVVVYRGELTFHIAREHLVEVARMLRDEPGLRYELCLGVTGVHYPDDADRELHSLVHLMSITHNRRLRLETSVPDADPHLPSLYPVYPAVDWHERETYDMFGIIYDGHPALTRILMPDDWQGHPQRKDYPLGGIPVEFKGAQIPSPDQRRAYN